MMFMLKSLGDGDGDHGDGDGDAARCPSLSPILVESFKCQYDSRRQQLWLWYALVGKGPVHWPYHRPKYIEIGFRYLELNLHLCGNAFQSSHRIPQGVRIPRFDVFLLWKALKRGGVLARAKTLKVLHVITVVFEVGFV